MNDLKNSITVEFWNRVFGILSYISIFKIVCWILQKTIKINNWYQIVDIWVLFNFIFSIISVLVARYSNIEWINYILVTYGLLRVFEIIIYQINVLLFDEYRAKKARKIYAIRGYLRMVVNLLSNFSEIIFWFAVAYCVLLEHFVDSSELSLLQIMHTSMSFSTGFGMQDFMASNKITNIGACILYFQSIAGLVMTLISLARFINLLPNIKTKDKLEQD